MIRLRRTAARLAVALSATLLALGLGEWAVRRWAPTYDPSGQVQLRRQGDLVLGVPDSVARQRKNTGDYDVEVRFGPRGFRDLRDVAQAEPGDLLAVGDSFAFGWGVEEGQRWSDRLEAATGRRVYNVAIPGQNLDGYDRLVRQARTLGARASRLIVSLCMENDLGLYAQADAGAAAVVSVRPGASPLRPGASPLRSAKFWLAERSALYGLLTTAVHRSRAVEALAEGAGLVQPNLGAVGGAEVTQNEIEATADRLAALAQGYGTTVLIVPSRALWLEPVAAEADRSHRAMVAALAARGLDVVDPRAAFEATGAPLSMHFAGDGHWNARGHDIAAECLARH